MKKLRTVLIGLSVAMSMVMPAECLAETNKRMSPYGIAFLEDAQYPAVDMSVKGMRLCIGKSAVLRTGNLDILVCCTPGGTGDLNFYRGFGLDPADYRLVVVKACTSFRETYASLAAEILVADSEGAAANDLGRLPFSRIPRIGFYPFDPATRTDGGA